MTVQTNTSRADYNCNGVTTAFTVPFYFLNNSDVTVLLTTVATNSYVTLNQGTDYNISGAGVPAGGTITTTTAYSSAYRLTVLRSVAATQLTSYPSNGPFPAATHEMALDKLTMLVQQALESIGRGVTLPANVSGVSTSLPAPLANQFLAWNSAATGLINIDAASFLTVAGSSGFTTQTATGDGTTVAFTLSGAPGAIANLEVFETGVRQVPTTDYSVASNVVTFTTAPANGVKILFRWGQTLGIGIPSDTSVTSAKLDPNALNATVHAAVSKTTPVDADETLLVDSAASNGLKKLTWANVKSAIKTYLQAGLAMTGPIKFAAGNSIASAATVDLTVATGNTVHITGTTGIGAWTMTAGQFMQVIFDGILTLTHNATTNNLLGAANITTAAGDRATVYYDGTTTYVFGYFRADGTSLVSSGGNQKLAQVASINTTSGTSIDFSSLSLSGATIKRITLEFFGVGTNGTANKFVQIGSSNTPANSGYNGSAGNAGASTAFTAAFSIYSLLSADRIWGKMEIVNVTGNSWVAAWTFGNSAGSTGPHWGGGGITLAGPLNIVRLTTSNGTDTYAAGSAALMLEGV